MPMDGVMLGCLQRELAQQLIGGRVDKVTQPERDELNILIRSLGENKLLLLSASANNARVHLTASRKNNPMEPPTFCMLLRKHLQGGRVSDVRQIGGDRILEIDVESLDDLGDMTVKTLICELMGRHSNLILTDSKGKIIDSIRHVTDEISRVREVLPGLMYERPPAQDKLPFRELEEQALYERLKASGSGPLFKALAAHISGLSLQTARELSFRFAGDEEAHLEALEAAQIARQTVEFFGALDRSIHPSLVLREDGSPLDMTAFPFLSRAALPHRDMPSLSAMMDEYYSTRDRFEHLKQKSASLHRVLKNNIERCEKKLGLQLAALQDSARMEEYRIKGELITASLHACKTGQREVLLTNYYDPDCALMKIELDEKLSPSQNAQRYFKLYQKAKSAQTLAADQKRMTEAELAYLEGQLDNLGKCVEEAELNELRQELEKEGYVRANHNRRQLKQLPPSKPMHYLSSSGIHILIGKNNLQNDKLTQTANPTDYWLHAKDMPGSHTIVVSANPDEVTLREAAMLAAHYSKGKGSSQVPVDYTQRKYVKKPSGAKPGFVIYTHQKTLFVTPDEEKIKKMQTL